MKRMDAVIIGFGKGGKTLALDLAGRGWQVAMVEKSDKMYGGACINVACIPTKMLVHKAKIAHLLKLSSYQEKDVFYRKAIADKNEFVEKLRQKNYNNLAVHPNITIYNGTGSFLSPGSLKVDLREKGTVELSASYFFINTGAETVLPEIEGVRGNRFVYTSTSIMELDKLPPRLVIVGGGYIGMEFASMYASFGANVTVLEQSARLLKREDEEVSQQVQEVLKKKGISFRFHAKTTAVAEEAHGAVVVYTDAEGKENRMEADAVLVATGRRPYTEGLHPELAGVNLDEQGAVRVDSYLKTSNPAIYAIGDVKGGAQFTYLSLDDYRIIRQELFGAHEFTTHGREGTVYSMFIDPPLAHVGLHEAEAMSKGYEIRVNKILVSSLPRAGAIGETEGILKAIIDKKTEQILGCTLFCAESSEIINLVSMAIKLGLTSATLRDFVFTHPSMCESFNDLFK